MALVVKDRVKVTSTTTGTGTFTLGSAVLGFQDFSVIGDGNTTYYTITGVGSAEFEVGIGTFTASGTTLSRDTILESSNAGSAVNFSAGAKEVFVTYPAERAVYTDAAGTAITPSTASVLGISFGGTGSTSTTFVNLATNVTGTLPVANGGTGITSFGTGVATFLGTPSSANLAAAVTDETGSGALVFATSPTLVTPALGTPSALVGTNITGTASGLTAGNVTTNANLTGAVTSTGNATVLGSFSSANLAGALTDETGTGAAVFATSPTFVTPLLGTPTSGNLANCTFPTLNQNTTGNAATATTLQTARTIGGVSFNGSANINLPGVNTAGNQNTTGTAANVTGTVGAANGGTGRTTLTANNVLLGNGTGTVNFVAPSTSGNVLTSNGSTWISAAPAGAQYDANTSSTGFFDLPAGTTGQRPGSPNTGMIRFNTTESEYEVYTTDWRPITLSNYPYTIEYLMIAGGGGGSTNRGGGGGAGGYRSSVVGSSSGGGASAEATLSVTPGITSFSLVIGAGGGQTTVGSNTTGFSLTASGGGAGGPPGTAGGGGGSGGGGGHSSAAGGAGTSGQGFAGGNSASSHAGGGGGAGQVGAVSGGGGGNGGNGVSSPISGSAITRAGGGGGGANSAAVGTGGSGGGGNGSTGAPAGNGSVNTGSGGGGAGFAGSFGSGGSGGSGVVFIRYTGSQKGTGGNTITTAGGFTVHAFTSSGTFTA